jgi:hypothetical protein
MSVKQINSDNLRCLHSTSLKTLFPIEELMPVAILDDLPLAMTRHADLLLLVAWDSNTSL